MGKLRLPALEIDQGNGRLLYSFGVDGKKIPEFAEISRISRNGAEVIGYQRPEVLSHIAEIRRYLESEAPMIPNSVVIAFDQSVRFEADKGSSTGPGYCRCGTLVLPTRPRKSSATRAGWVVDGQQRLAAIREAGVDEFPLSVVGFSTKSTREQREQFILVNSTKPLPKGLIYELLPDTEGTLPTALHKRRFPATVMNRLNSDPNSPLSGRIKSPTNPEGVIKDNSILRMLENSLSDGALYRFRSGISDEADSDAMIEVLFRYWRAVALTFPDAWELPPRRSRLVHGAGIVSMGFLMDAITDRYREVGIPTVEDYASNLETLQSVCRWTDGYWEFGPGAQRKWNEIQNTSKDIQLLANYLLVRYRAAEPKDLRAAS